MIGRGGIFILAITLAFILILVFDLANPGSFSVPLAWKVCGFVLIIVAGIAYIALKIEKPERGQGGRKIVEDEEE